MSKQEENKLAADISLLIRANGLGQTMAFLSSRRREDFRILYRIINQWAEINLPELTGLAKNNLEINIVDLITRCDSARVREISREIIEYLKTLPIEIINSSQAEHSETQPDLESNNGANDLQLEVGTSLDA